MEKSLKIFISPSFGQIRTMRDEKGETRFCLLDVCNALTLNPSKVAQRLDDDMLSRQVVRDARGRRQPATLFVTEAGLYETILLSRKPEAKAFRRWITTEVLPALRKDGGYMMAREGESNEELLARAMVVAQATIARKDEQIQRLQPKADYADSVLSSVSCLTTTQIAKELDMTARELNRLLREMRIIYWQSGQYMLYASYARQGYARDRTICRHDRWGKRWTRRYLVWTEKGRAFIHSIINSKN